MGPIIRPILKSDGSTTADEGSDNDAACAHRRKIMNACDKSGREEEE